MYFKILCNYTNKYFNKFTFYPDAHSSTEILPELRFFTFYFLLFTFYPPSHCFKWVNIETKQQTMKYKIIVLDGKGLNPGDMSWRALEKLGDVDIYDNTPYNKIVERSIKGDIVIINKCNFDKHILSALPNLKYICESATGYDNIDLMEANKREIIVSNVKGYSTTSVVQQVFALIFALTNKSEYYSTQVHKERWTNYDFFTFWDFPISEISGKTLGLYGFGKIASKVAKIANAFGMNIIANRKNPDKGYGDSVIHANLDELIAKSDILSLHAPQTQDNVNLINKLTLSNMKYNALLINTARGKMINERDLREALDNNIIAGAGLDVLSTEPPRNDNPMIGAKNCIITPHQAWTSIEARQKLMSGVIDNINGFIEGKLINVVN